MRVIQFSVTAAHKMPSTILVHRKLCMTSIAFQVDGLPYSTHIVCDHATSDKLNDVYLDQASLTLASCEMNIVHRGNAEDCVEYEFRLFFSEINDAVDLSGI